MVGRPYNELPALCRASLAGEWRLAPSVDAALLERSDELGGMVRTFDEMTRALKA